MLFCPSEFLLNTKSDNYIPLGVTYNFERVFPVFDIFPRELIIRLVEMENITINRTVFPLLLRLISVNYADISI